MKLKQQPDDFHVEELTDLIPGAAGTFAFYRLDKTGWTTWDALAAIRQRWHLEPGRISYAGLKDRHAHTKQYLTIHHGPRRDLQHDKLHLTYLGQIESPYSSSRVLGNRFRITLRDLADEQRPAVERRLAHALNHGVPNYFDDQRFGSVAGPDGEWIGRLVVQGRFEDALRLALTAPYDFDRPADKREKHALAQHWGDWEKLANTIPRGPTRRIVEHLRNRPTDFRGAFLQLRTELRTLYLSAYQSHLWNLILSHVVETRVEEAARAPIVLKTGPVWGYGELPSHVKEQLEGLTLPLPTARWHPESNDARLPFVETVLAREQLTLRDLQVRGVRELFFSRGDRAATCRPANLAYQWDSDDRHQGRARLTVSFDLPRGSYATIVIKALTSL